MFLQEMILTLMTFSNNLSDLYAADVFHLLFYTSKHLENFVRM